MLVKIKIIKNGKFRYKFLKASVLKKILSDILKNNTPIDKKIRTSIENNKKDNLREGFSKYSNILYIPKKVN